mmetsp:Transcript_28370/g.83303  ORF Transcript_28370/g.83303 Transcript_28370/m.83303 type:complete len:320 (+) Transcript_28370:267-1226(+)
MCGGSGLLLRDAETLVVHEGKVSLGHGHDSRLRCQTLAVHLGQAHDALVADAVEELQLARDALGDEAVHRLRGQGRAGRGRVAEGEIPAPLVAEGVDRLVVAYHFWEDSCERAVDRRKDNLVLLYARLARLSHEQAARGELALRHGIKFGCIELIARPPLERVVQIHDNHVVAAVRSALEHGLGIVDDQLQARVRKGPGILWQVGLAKVDHVRVDVHHGALGHRPVAQHLACSRALAAAANVDGARVRVQQHCRVHQALVVDELIYLRRLDQAVDEQAAAKGLQVHHVHRLELRLARVEDLVNAVGRAEAGLQLLLDHL